MADVVSPAKRSQMMSGISGKNSLPEMVVRKTLFAMGHRSRLHRRDLRGTPDIAMPNRKIAIFVHGCFWHAHQGCKCAKTPSTLSKFFGLASCKIVPNATDSRRQARGNGLAGAQRLGVLHAQTTDRDWPGRSSAALDRQRCSNQRNQRSSFGGGPPSLR